MSGELAQGGEAGRDKGKAEGGSSAKGRTEPQPYTSSKEEAAVSVPWAFWSFYLSAVRNPVFEALQLQTVQEALAYIFIYIFPTMRQM